MTKAEKIALLLSGLHVSWNWGLDSCTREILTELKELLPPDEFKSFVERLFPGNWLLGIENQFADLIEESST